jgi:itaconate CoA-transferase
VNVPRRPLEGVVVVAVEQAVAAPLATRQLADLGARVIKVERSGSGDFARGYDSRVDGLSSAFLWLNRGKESVVLDLKREDDRTALEQLVGRCDVFVQNLSPLAAKRAGLDPDSIQKRHPGVIACAISGYGNTGPLADRKAYDLLVQGETGMISLTGDEDKMAKVGISIADIAAGSYAYASILASLLHRDRTGEALPIEVSLFDSLTEWLSYPLYYTMYGGSAPDRRGISHATIAPYGAFTTGDGNDVLIAVQNEREWIRFCDMVLNKPFLANDARFNSPERRLENSIQLNVHIAESFSRFDRDEALDRLQNAGVAYSRLNGIAALAEHEQLVERGRWTETTTSTGTVRTLLPPWLPDAHRVPLGEVPDLGQHTEEIMAWLSRPCTDVESPSARRHARHPD